MPFHFKYMLPKTGQKSAYWHKDDGYIEAGWDRTQRYIIRAFGGIQMVIDRATSLMWPRDYSDTGWNPYLTGSGLNWYEALDAVENTINAGYFGGFNDWRCANAYEGTSILPFDDNKPFMNYPWFAWLSTTFGWDPVKANMFPKMNDNIGNNDKVATTKTSSVYGTIEMYPIFCRDHHG